jgi:hypothetical protein
VKTRAPAIEAIPLRLQSDRARRPRLSKCHATLPRRSFESLAALNCRPAATKFVSYKQSGCDGAHRDDGKRFVVRRQDFHWKICCNRHSFLEVSARSLRTDRAGRSRAAPVRVLSLCAERLGTTFDNGSRQAQGAPTQLCDPAKAKRSLELQFPNRVKGLVH